jgi:hypothetical protein
MTPKQISKQAPHPPALSAMRFLQPHTEVYLKPVSERAAWPWCLQVSHLEQPSRAAYGRTSPFCDLNANDASGITISQEHLGQPIELATRRPLRENEVAFHRYHCYRYGVVPHPGRERLVELEKLTGFRSGSRTGRFLGTTGFGE